MRSAQRAGAQIDLPIDNAAERKRCFVKAADVITYTEHGACDLGIVGKDTIMEYSAHLYETMDLKISKCRLAVAKPDAGFLGHRTQARGDKIYKYCKELL